MGEYRVLHARWLACTSTVRSDIGWRCDGESDGERDDTHGRVKAADGLNLRRCERTDGRMTLAFGFVLENEGMIDKTLLFDIEARGEGIVICFALCALRFAFCVLRFAFARLRFVPLVLCTLY